MSQMSNLSIAVSDMVNDYIAKGMTTEEVFGVLGMAAFRVAQASSNVVETEPVGGGSPVSFRKIDYRKETSPEQKEDS